jgi:hypothetical protein
MSPRVNSHLVYLVDMTVSHGAEGVWRMVLGGEAA